MRRHASRTERLPYTREKCRRRHGGRSPASPSPAPTRSGMCRRPRSGSPPPTSPGQDFALLRRRIRPSQRRRVAAETRCADSRGPRCCGAAAAEPRCPRCCGDASAEARCPRCCGDASAETAMPALLRRRIGRTATPALLRRRIGRTARRPRCCSDAAAGPSRASAATPRSPHHALLRKRPAWTVQRCCGDAPATPNALLRKRSARTARPALRRHAHRRAAVRSWPSTNRRSARRLRGTAARGRGPWFRAGRAPR